MKTTKYRIVDVLRDRSRLYVTDWMAAGGDLDFYYVWSHDVRKATVFDTRDQAIIAAERIEARIRAWRGQHPDHGNEHPRPNPVRIVPTSGGNWVEWTPAAASPLASSEKGAAS
jgi:hypothetical protein